MSTADYQARGDGEDSRKDSPPPPLFLPPSYLFSCCRPLFCAIVRAESTLALRQLPSDADCLFSLAFRLLLLACLPGLLNCQGDLHPCPRLRRLLLHKRSSIACRHNLLAATCSDSSSSSSGIRCATLTLSLWNAVSGSGMREGTGTRGGAVAQMRRRYSCCCCCCCCC